MMTRTSLIVLCLFGIVFLQFMYDKAKPDAGFAPLVVFPVPVLRSVDLGLNEASASLLWLNAIQEIGAVNGSYEGLVYDMKTITALDPHFAYPYAFAELVIPALDQSKTADVIAMGQQGAQQVSDWRVPFYLATAYLIYEDDRVHALQYFDAAARTPGIPSGIQATALNFGTRKDNRAQTRAIWSAIYNNTNDDILREQAQNNIAHIDILTQLDRDIQTYKQATGAYPKTLDDLVHVGIITAVPQDPFGFTYMIDKDGKLGSHLSF